MKEPKNFAALNLIVIAAASLHTMLVLAAVMILSTEALCLLYKSAREVGPVYSQADAEKKSFRLKRSAYYLSAALSVIAAMYLIVEAASRGFIPFFTKGVFFFLTRKEK